MKEKTLSPNEVLCIWLALVMMLRDCWFFIFYQEKEKMMKNNLAFSKHMF